MCLRDLAEVDVLDVFYFSDVVNQCDQGFCFVHGDVDAEFCVVVWECFPVCVFDVDRVACDRVECLRKESDTVVRVDDEFDAGVERVMPGCFGFFLCRVAGRLDVRAVRAVDGDFVRAAFEASDLVSG